MTFSVDKDAYKLENSDKPVSSASNIINESGFYDVTLASVAMKKTSSGNPYIHIRYRKGVDNTSGGVGHLFFWLTRPDGTESFDKKTFMDLMVVLGISKLGEPVPTQIEYKEGSKTEDCWKEFENKVVHLYCRKTYYLNKAKEVQEKLDRITFFDSKKRNAFEVINGMSEANRYKKLQSNPDNLKPNYANDCTYEMVEAHKASFRNDKVAEKATESKPSFLSSLDGLDDGDEIPF